MPQTRVSRIPDPIGIEGQDQATQASPTNPLPVSLSGLGLGNPRNDTHTHLLIPPGGMDADEEFYSNYLDVRFKGNLVFLLAALEDFATVELRWSADGVNDLSRVITDGETTTGTPTLTSPSGTFTAYDVGTEVTGTGIPADTHIGAYVSPTEVTLTKNATATATGVTVTLDSPVGVSTLTNEPTESGPLTFNVYLDILNIFIGGNYVRSHIINGPFAQSAAAFPTGTSYIGLVTTGKESYIPLIGVDETISLIARAVLTRNITTGQDRFGQPRNTRSSDTDALFTHDERLHITQSGSLFAEGISDHITLIGSRDRGAKDILLWTDLNGEGTLTHDGDPTTGEGQFVFTALPGDDLFFRSVKTLRYDDAAHTMRADVSVETDGLYDAGGVWQAGTTVVEFGPGEDHPVTPTGAIFNGIYDRIDSTGLHYVRTKHGTDEQNTLSGAGNRDSLDGSPASLFRRDGIPEPIDVRNNNYYLWEFPWLGISPPAYAVQNPNRDILDVHIEETPNSGKGTTIPEPNIPIVVHIKVDAAAPGPVTVRVGSVRGGTYNSKIISQGRQPDGDLADVPSDGLGASAEETLTNAAPVTFTVDTATDEIIATGHGLSDEDAVSFSTTGALPEGLYPGVPYLVAVTSADRFQVKRSAVTTAPVADITTAGSGTHSYVHHGQIILPVIDSDQWRSNELIVNGTTQTLRGGILVEHVENTGASPVVVRDTQTFEFGPGEVSKGYLNGWIPPNLDGYRVRLINGNTSPSTFFIATSLRVNAVELPRHSSNGFNSLLVMQGHRIGQGPGKRQARVAVTNLGGTSTTLTVTDEDGNTYTDLAAAGLVFWMTAYSWTLLNSSTAGVGQARILDGIGGELRIPMLANEASGLIGTEVGEGSNSFPDQPLPFDSLIRYDFVSGTISVDLVLSGYIEEAI